MRWKPPLCLDASPRKILVKRPGVGSVLFLLIYVSRNSWIFPLACADAFPRSAVRRISPSRGYGTFPSGVEVSSTGAASMAGEYGELLSPLEGG